MLEVGFRCGDDSLHQLSGLCSQLFRERARNTKHSEYQKEGQLAIFRWRGFTRQRIEWLAAYARLCIYDGCGWQFPGPCGGHAER